MGTRRIKATINQEMKALTVEVVDRCCDFVMELLGHSTLREAGAAQLAGGVVWTVALEETATFHFVRSGGTTCTRRAGNIGPACASERCLPSRDC